MPALCPAVVADSVRMRMAEEQVMANVHDLKRLWIVTYHVYHPDGREWYSHATLCATPEIREKTLTEYRATYQDVRVSGWEQKGWN